MKKLNKILAVGLVGLMSLCLSYSGHSADWYVATNGTGQGTNGWSDATNDLQGAITACGSGDTTWVSNGVYAVNLTVGAGVVVRSIDNIPANVTISGVGGGPVVSLAGWLIGVTVTNGNGFAGGGINGSFAGNVSNCVISGNTAGVGGGGVAWCTVYNSTISGNTAPSSTGGGVLQSTLYDCIIKGNSSIGNGGGVNNCAVYNSEISGNISSSEGGGASAGTLYNCIISNNNGSMGGGGIANVTVASNCTISGNTGGALGGGAVWCTVYNSVIKNNNANSGGGINGSDCYNSLIISNTASSGGGGVQGGSIYNCTVVGNTGYNPGGGCMWSTVKNSISWDNNYPDDFSDGGSTAYSCGVGNNYTNATCTTNNPAFVGGTNYGLQTGSPCIDVGDNSAWAGLSNSLDLAGNVRIYNTIVDMGAYEKQGAPPHDWYVATNGTGQGTSWADATNDLQGAITACSSDYTVWVSNGTYIVNLTVGNGVIVRSKTGLPADVILDGNASGRVALMDELSWLIGVTVTNGNATDTIGAGVRYGSISNCIISGNNMSGDSGWGGGCGNATIYNSIIRGNTSSGNKGGGVRLCTVYNSLITENSALIAGAGGHLSTFYNSTISSNSTEGHSAGGQYCSFINSISWNNSSADYFAGDETVLYSCGVGFTTLGFSGTGCITNDPLFISSTDFRLQSGSPCKDTGDNGGWAGLSNSLDVAGNARIYNTIVDMGAYERYPLPPSKATNPFPTNNSSKQATTTIVSWQNGGEATGYIINFGLSGNMTNCGSTTSTNYNPGTLLYSSNYQWRIDATNTAGTTTGDVWSITIRDVTTVIEKNKLIVSNDFQVTGNSVLNNTEVDGTYKKILKIGNTTTIAEKSYQWSTNTWIATINTNESQCNRLIGIALGTNSTSQGMLILGDLTVTNANLIPGSEIFISSTVGEWTQTTPTNSTYIIRAIGYATESNKIYVKPDGVWGSIE